MSFQLRWTTEASEVFRQLQGAAERAGATKARKQKPTKSSKQEGLFKQVAKCVRQLAADPRHKSLHTYEYASLAHPFDPSGKVFEAYAQNNTPGAYRVFWCYGPGRGDITILAITPHP